MGFIVMHSVWFEAGLFKSLADKFTLKYYHNGSEAEFDKEDEDHYASIKDTQHYSVPA